MKYIRVSQRILNLSSKYVCNSLDFPASMNIEHRYLKHGFHIIEDEGCCYDQDKVGGELVEIAAFP